MGFAPRPRWNDRPIVPESMVADATLRAFDRLAECARAVLRAGHPVIVDAAFLRRAERDVLRAAAVSRKR